MLPNRSLLVPPTSGFVPFSGGGLPDDLLEHEPVARAPRRPAPDVAEARPSVLDRHPEAMSEAAAPLVARPGMRSVAWAPSTTLAVRRVEMGVLAAMCGYFTFGLGKLLGLF
jgi:hypothetical protein